MGKEPGVSDLCLPEKEQPLSSSLAPKIVDFPAQLTVTQTSLTITYLAPGPAQDIKAMSNPGQSHQPGAETDYSEMESDKTAVQWNGDLGELKEQAGKRSYKKCNAKDNSTQINGSCHDKEIIAMVFKNRPTTS